MQFSIDDSPTVMARFVMGKCVECGCSVWGHGFGELGMFLCCKCPTSEITRKGNRDVGGPLHSYRLPQICVPNISPDREDDLRVTRVSLDMNVEGESPISLADNMAVSVPKFRGSYRPRDFRDKKLLYEMQRRLCVYCLKSTDFREATKEHLRPRSHEGENVWENIALACRTCNDERSTRPISEPTFPISTLQGVP